MISSIPLASATLTSIVAQAVSTSASSSNGTSISSTQAGAENGECRLLGPFALFVQGALGILALGSLVFKRWRERPQRPLKIWAFDASKQVVGSGLLHLANLFMSMLSSGELTPTTPKAGDYQANPCSFYLLNLAIDVCCPSASYRAFCSPYYRLHSAYLSLYAYCGCSPMPSGSLHLVNLPDQLNQATMASPPRPSGG